MTLTLNPIPEGCVDPNEVYSQVVKVWNAKFSSNNSCQIKAQTTLNALLKEGKHPFQLHNSSKISWTCERCGRSGKGATNYKRYHGERCKYDTKL